MSWHGLTWFPCLIELINAMPWHGLTWYPYLTKCHIPNMVLHGILVLVPMPHLDVVLHGVLNQCRCHVLTWSYTGSFPYQCHVLTWSYMVSLTVNSSLNAMLWTWTFPSILNCHGTTMDFEISMPCQVIAETYLLQFSRLVA